MRLPFQSCNNTNDVDRNKQQLQEWLATKELFVKISQELNYAHCSIAGRNGKARCFLYYSEAPDIALPTTIHGYGKVRWSLSATAEDNLRQDSDFDALSTALDLIL